MRGEGWRGGEGVLNPCGFVGCDLPCVQVTEPLLPLRPQNKCRCYLFYTDRLLATSRRGWIFFFFFYSSPRWSGSQRFADWRT